MKPRPLGLQALGVLSAAGLGTSGLLDSLLSPAPHYLSERADLLPERSVMVGAVNIELPAVPAALQKYGSRNLQLALAALEQVRPTLEALQSRYPRQRLGIVLGTSTSGISEGEQAVARWQAGQALPAHYDYAQQEMGSPALALREHLGWSGPAFCISTACSGSAKALASAQRLLQANICDVVLAGGVDSLCRLTLNGFAALESLSAHIAQPFQAARDGINIGEAAALFVISREDSAVRLIGAGESADAYHISAPQPEGLGAEQAMRRALKAAGLAAADIHHLNLHGTGTAQNDQMEARAVARVFGQGLSVSATKPLTGHCLGAAGALEAGIAYALLSPENSERRLSGRALPSFDPALPELRWADAQSRLPTRGARIMSNSFAFGGSNIALILEAAP